jgi:hypothetical protein
MDILKSYDANFVRLGSRGYVHGSSMTHSLLEVANTWALGPVERLRATFHSILKEQGRYDLFRDPKPKHLVKKGYIVLFHLQCEKDEFLVGIKGRGQPVSVSVPYDEEEMIASCEISGAHKAASILIHPGNPIVNFIIALNKKLLLSILPTEGYSQWFLARYDFELRKTEFIEPKLLNLEVASIIGLTNAKSLIKLGSEPIGSIYFSRKGRLC